MTDSSGPPFRADHVGSLLRPTSLLEARARHAAGRDRRRRAARRSRTTRSRDVVRMQAGRRAADGDRRRVPPRLLAHGLHLPLDGISQGPTRTIAGALPQRRAATSTSPRRRCRSTAASGSTQPIFGDGLRLLQSVGDRRQTPKLTIPSPSMVHYRGGPAAIDPSVYPDEDAFWDDLSAAYAEQVRRLAALGCTLPAARRHQPGLPQRPRSSGPSSPRRGGDAEHQHERYIRQINAALAGRPDGADGHHPHVPRQLPLVLGGRGRLRLRGRGAVRRAGGRRLLPRVRRRPLRRLRAAAVRAAGQARRARAW